MENTGLNDDSLHHAGLVRVFDSRAVRIKDEYDRRLAAARDKVDLVGFGLRALREDYGAQLPELASRARVRFLLLHPEFPTAEDSIAALRDREERNSSGSIRSDIKEFLIQVVPQTRRNDISLSVRLYRALPMINIFRIDDDLFWGPYLIDEQSRNCPTFLVRRGGSLFERYTRQFEFLWSDEWSQTPEQAGLA